MARAAKGSAPFFLPEFKNNVKGDGQECPSYTNKTKVKSDGQGCPSYTNPASWGRA